jgi:hypothetical protein
MTLTVTEKYCPRCKQTLPLDEFAADKSRKDGKAAYCLIDDKCRRYGISRKKYIELLNSQNGKCGFPGCEAIPNEIDHDYDCCSKKHGCAKCVRALLCSKHNLALGQFNDNAKQLTEAIRYLNNFDNKTICLFEILVPTVRNNGRPYTTKFHKVWDKKVRAISGGLTIMAPSKGQWVAPDGTLFVERMIPVRFLATRQQAKEVINYTLKYYDQLAILCHEVSDTVILKYKEPQV